MILQHFDREKGPIAIAQFFKNEQGFLGTVLNK